MEHDEPSTRKQEGPTPAPEAFDLDAGGRGTDHELERGTDDGRGQPDPDLAAGRLGEAAAWLGSDAGLGRIAVEDLEDEPRRRCQWSRNGVATPVVFELVAKVGEGVSSRRGPRSRRKADAERLESWVE